MLWVDSSVHNGNPVLFINQHTHTHSWGIWRVMPNMTETYDCTTLSSSPPPLSFPFCPHSCFSLILSFPSPHFTPAFPSHSPCTPSPCLSCVFPTPISLSVHHLLYEASNCSILKMHSWWHWASLIWHSDDVRPGTAWPRDYKNTTVLERSRGSVSATASVLMSSGRDAPESVSVSVSFPVTHE